VETTRDDNGVERALFDAPHCAIESAHLLDDEKKVHKGGREGGNVGDYGHDFALQAVQELLQFALLTCHLDIEMVHSVFHFLVSYL
jgi:hypothetical protein